MIFAYLLNIVISEKFTLQIFLLYSIFGKVLVNFFKETSN